MQKRKSGDNLSLTVKQISERFKLDYDELLASYIKQEYVTVTESGEIKAGKVLTQGSLEGMYYYENDEIYLPLKLMRVADESHVYNKEL